MNNEALAMGRKSSEIRMIFEYGKKRKAEIGEDNVFDFSLGNPAAPAPEEVAAALKEALTDPTVHGYTSAVGDYSARKAIADSFNSAYGLCEKPENVYITCGAAAAVVSVLRAVLGEGEEVIVFAPFFPEYQVFIGSARGKMKFVSCPAPDFQPSADALEKAINEKTRAVIINSPNNPTGAVISAETLGKIADVLRKKSEEYSSPIYLVSDEPYRELVYRGTKVPCPLSYYDNTVICYSFSKSLSLPGERIGYALVSEKCENGADVAAAIAGAARSFGYVCAPSLFQKALPSLIGKTADFSLYEKNGATLYDFLTETGYEAVRPDGAFYLFVKALEPDAKKFAERAKKYELLLVPSDSFGVEGYVRIAYCVTEKTVKNSLAAFEKLYREYKENPI